MDFQQAFFEIDTDHSGEITKEELVDYMRKKNYKETFVERWLNIFDVDHSGTISYQEYCETLGLIPKKEDLERVEASRAKAESEGGAGRRASAQKVEKMEVSEEVVTTKKTAGSRSAPKAAREEPIKDQKAKKIATTPARKDGKGSCRASECRNSVISAKFGIMRFSRARVIEKKALYRVKPGTSRAGAKEKTGKQKAVVTMTEKEVGGERNGEKRMVPSARSPRSVPTQEGKRRKGRAGKTKCLSEQRHRLRRSIQPGSVLILLSGKHRGKRVVFLKQMKASGLLLVTGPFKLNGCPLRRVNQRFVIATRTRVPLDNVTLPERLTDQYFRRAKKTRKAQAEGDIYQQSRAQYAVTEERKEDQKAVDTAVMSAIGDHKDGTALRGYLRNLFCLKAGDRPHNMLF